MCRARLVADAAAVGVPCSVRAGDFDRATPAELANADALPNRDARRAAEQASCDDDATTSTVVSRLPCLATVSAIWVVDLVR